MRIIRNDEVYHGAKDEIDIILSLSKHVSMRVIRILIGILLSAICINAFGGGYYGMSGAADIPKEWLKGSAFNSYFVPSLFLFVVIGESCLLGAIMAFRNSRYTRTISFFCSIVLLIWILIQIQIIGSVSWLQQAVVVVALIVFGLAYFLKPVQLT